MPSSKSSSFCQSPQNLRTMRRPQHHISEGSNVVPPAWVTSSSYNMKPSIPTHTTYSTSTMTSSSPFASALSSASYEAHRSLSTGSRHISIPSSSTVVYHSTFQPVRIATGPRRIISSSVQVRTGPIIEGPRRTITEHQICGTSPVTTTISTEPIRLYSTTPSVVSTTSVGPVRQSTTSSIHQTPIHQPHAIPLDSNRLYYTATGGNVYDSCYSPPSIASRQLIYQQLHRSRSPLSNRTQSGLRSPPARMGFDNLSREFPLTPPALVRGDSWRMQDCETKQHMLATKGNPHLRSDTFRLLNKLNIQDPLTTVNPLGMAKSSTHKLT